MSQRLRPDNNIEFLTQYRLRLQSNKFEHGTGVGVFREIIARVFKIRKIILRMSNKPPSTPSVLTFACSYNNKVIRKTIINARYVTIVPRMPWRGRRWRRNEKIFLIIYIVRKDNKIRKFRFCSFILVIMAKISNTDSEEFQTLYLHWKCFARNAVYSLRACQSGTDWNRRQYRFFVLRSSIFSCSYSSVNSILAVQLPKIQPYNPPPSRKNE